VEKCAHRAKAEDRLKADLPANRVALHVAIVATFVSVSAIAIALTAAIAVCARNAEFAAAAKHVAIV
jgi:hypothetical protein